MATAGASIGDIPLFHCLLVGASNVGKTSYIYKALHGADVVEKYSGGRGYDPLVFHTTRGWIKMKLWDITLQEGCKIKDYASYNMRHAAIIMFDVRDRKSYLKVGQWCNALRFTGREEAKVNAAGIGVTQCEMVIVGNKDDAGGAKPSTREVYRDTGLEIVRISTRTSPPERLRHPLLILARKLLRDPLLELLPIEGGEAQRLKMSLGTTQFEYPMGVGYVL